MERTRYPDPDPGPDRAPTTAGHGNRRSVAGVGFAAAVALAVVGSPLPAAADPEVTEILNERAEEERRANEAADPGHGYDDQVIEALNDLATGGSSPNGSSGSAGQSDHGGADDPGEADTDDDDNRSHHDDDDDDDPYPTTRNFPDAPTDDDDRADNNDTADDDDPADPGHGYDDQVIEALNELARDEAADAPLVVGGVTLDEPDDGDGADPSSSSGERPGGDGADGGSEADPVDRMTDYLARKAADALNQATRTSTYSVHPIGQTHTTTIGLGELPIADGDGKVGVEAAITVSTKEVDGTVYVVAEATAIVSASAGVKVGRLGGVELAGSFGPKAAITVALPAGAASAFETDPAALDAALTHPGASYTLATGLGYAASVEGARSLLGVETAARVQGAQDRLEATKIVIDENGRPMTFTGDRVKTTVSASLTADLLGMGTLSTQATYRDTSTPLTGVDADGRPVHRTEQTTLVKGHVGVNDITAGGTAIKRTFVDNRSTAAWTSTAEYATGASFTVASRPGEHVEITITSPDGVPTTVSLDATNLAAIHTEIARSRTLDVPVSPITYAPQAVPRVPVDQPALAIDVDLMNGTDGLHDAHLLHAAVVANEAEYWAAIARLGADPGRSVDVGTAPEQPVTPTVEGGGDAPRPTDGGATRPPTDTPTIDQPTAPDTTPTIDTDTGADGPEPIGSTPTGEPGSTGTAVAPTGNEEHDDGAGETGDGQPNDGQSLPEPGDDSELPASLLRALLSYALNTAAYNGGALGDGAHPGATAIAGVRHRSTLTRSTAADGAVTLTVTLQGDLDGAAWVIVRRSVFADLAAARIRWNQALDHPTTRFGAGREPIAAVVDRLTDDQVEQVARHALNTAAYSRLVDGRHPGRTTIDGGGRPSVLTIYTGGDGRVSLTVDLDDDGQTVIVVVRPEVFRRFLDGAIRADAVTAEPTTRIIVR